MQEESKEDGPLEQPPAEPLTPQQLEEARRRAGPSAPEAMAYALMQICKEAGGEFSIDVEKGLSGILQWRLTKTGFAFRFEEHNAAQKILRTGSGILRAN